ncbi:PREDICTED: uncharacterized protein LOC108762717 [Trachymyrmex cornetzi]|nr:PREDICTED: uncharacterized protein LOC108762717 [Trachymyrmex cornetzi]
MMHPDPEMMERLWAWDRVLAGRRVMERVMEWIFLDVWCWMYRRAMGIERENVDGNAAASSSPLSQETSASSAGRTDPPSVGCKSEVCRYIAAGEKTLLWENSAFFVNLYLFIVLIAIFWIYTLMGMTSPLFPYKLVAVYCISQLIIAYKFMDTLAPAVEQRECCGLHWVWQTLKKLRSEKPGLHCIVLCLVAFFLWFLDHVHTSTLCFMYYGMLLACMLLRFPLKLFDKAREYLLSHKDWQCDSEIEDEFLPVVTEASLLVLTRVGETGDHSPTPTSVQSDTQNDSFYDEDFIEGLQEIAFNMPSHGEGSTDGVELSELELSVGENDAEEDGIKFQSGHFEKSSSSSSEEEVFDAKKIAASSDESNGDSDFEIIDKEEIAKIEM